MAKLAVRGATLLALEEDDENMRAIYGFFPELEKAQDPQAVKKRNKEQALARKQKEDARWADECATYDRRKSKRVRHENEDSNDGGDGEPEYNANHQVRDVEEDNHS